LKTDEYPHPHFLSCKGSIPIVLLKKPIGVIIRKKQRVKKTYDKKGPKILNNTIQIGVNNSRRQ